MAGTIPRLFIDDLLTRIDIVDVIDSRVTLKKAGKDYKACCPFHTEKSPSFVVSREKQLYHCFGCGASGSVIRFLMDYERLEFVETVQDLAKLVGLEVPFEGGRARRQPTAETTDLYELMAQVTKYYSHQLVQSGENEIAATYLKNRGLSAETIKHFDIGYAPVGWHNLSNFFQNKSLVNKQLIDAGMLIEKNPQNSYDRFRERVMFPIRDRRGRIIAFGGRVIGDGTPKYLNSPETSIFHKSYELYGLYQVLKKPGAVGSILVVEGYMDVVSLADKGVDNAVATLGTAITEHHAKTLVKYTDEIIYCFDGDKAGKKAAWRALEVSLSLSSDGQQFKFMFLPDGEDPDTMVSQLGKEGFRELQTQALPLTDFMIDELLKKADYRTIEGQVKLIGLAKPLMSTLPQGVFSRLLIARLAESTNLTEGALFAQIFPNVRQGKQKIRANKSMQAEKPSLIRLAIAMILENPALALEVEKPELLAKLKMPGVELLEELLEFVRKHPNITTGGILERWHGSREGGFLYKILQWEHHVPEAGMAKEFAGAISVLMRELKQQRTAELLAQSKITPLTNQEKAELVELLTQEVETTH